jgi:voltage-gated potassium channel Kch
MGLMWALAYKLVALYQPESFNPLNSPAVEQNHDITARLESFSYVTLTTVGYCDITPVNPIASTFAVLEVRIGQLFPVILIARLVSMELYCGTVK